MNSAAVLPLLATMAALPETVWLHGDDACDCTFQRIGLWKNPYLAETLEVRMCCIWEELYRLFPQHVRRTPAYLTGDDEWETAARAWDGETEMPRHLWYRQVAHLTGRPLAAVREELARQLPPAGTPRPPAPARPDIVAMLIATVEELAREVLALKERLP